MQTPKVSTATVPGWSPSTSASTTPAVDRKPPSLVGNLRITSNTEVVAVVSWDSSNDNVAVRGYVVRADGSTSETPAPPVSFSWGSRRTGAITVQVAAVDTSGNQGEWRTIVVTAPKGATTTQAVVTTAPVEVTTAPTPTPTETTTEPTTPPPPPPSSELPLVTTSPSQAGVPTDTSSPAAQQSTQ